MIGGLVQVIHLTYDKSARGGVGARQRSAVPSAMKIPVPATELPKGFLHVHRTEWGTSNQFAEPLRTVIDRVPLSDGFEDRGLTIAPHADGLGLRFQYQPAVNGMPDRSLFNWTTRLGKWHGLPVLLPTGQWATIQWNGRFSCIDSGNWWYEQTTIHVATYADDPDPQLFLRTKPNERLNLMAQLW